MHFTTILRYWNFIANFKYVISKQNFIQQYLLVIPCDLLYNWLCVVVFFYYPMLHLSINNFMQVEFKLYNEKYIIESCCYTTTILLHCNDTIVTEKHSRSLHLTSTRTLLQSWIPNRAWPKEVPYCRRYWQTYICLCHAYWKPCQLVCVRNKP